VKEVLVDTVPEVDRILDHLYKNQHKFAAVCRSIEQKQELLRRNPLCGAKIQRGRIPKVYQVKYRVDNLWNTDLAMHWRMLYTLNTNEVKILAILIDIMDHPSYDKKFGYRKK
jgi:hypothetical protein